MGIKTIAVLVATFGIGANVAMRMLEAYLSPMWKKIIGGASITLMVVSGGMLLYAFLTGIETEDIKDISSINQTITNSPGAINALGDVNVDRNRRITKEDEFVRALRAVGPVPIGLEAFEDREALLLYGQLYKVLESSKWIANERGTVSGQSWVGVHVVIQKDKAVPQGAIEMVKQLQANGIASDLVPERNPAPFEKVAFVVRIGLRPPSNNE